MQKQIFLHHSVTELGNLQLRQVVEYVEDGKVKDKKHSKPVTPADPHNMKDWDIKSQDIVSAILTPEVLAEFETEKQIPTGVGVEEIITHDRVIEEDGKIAARRITRIFDEGIEVSKKYYRSWIMPGQDPTGNDVISKALAEKLHTTEVIDAYKTKLVEPALLNEAGGMPMLLVVMLPPQIVALTFLICELLK